MFCFLGWWIVVSLCGNHKRWSGEPIMCDISYLMPNVICSCNVPHKFINIQSDVIFKLCIRCEFKHYSVTCTYTNRSNLHMNNNLQKPKCRVIKKSVWTWWLQYNHQVHKDFLITLYKTTCESDGWNACFWCSIAMA